MSHINVAVIQGRLTRDPVARGGGQVANLSLASNRQYQRNGAWVEETCFVEVSTFGFIAERCIERLKKGAVVTVNGRLELNTWQTETGENRQQVRIVASQVDSPSFVTNRPQTVPAPDDQPGLDEALAERAAEAATEVEPEVGVEAEAKPELASVA